MTFLDPDAAELLAVMPTSGRVLDLGAGESRFSRELLARGYDVVAVEPSPTLSSAAATATPHTRVLRADASALPFGDGGFDVVVACMSLQDFDDMPGSIKEASRVLRAGGSLCFAIVHPFNSARDNFHEDPLVMSRRYLDRRLYADTVERDGHRMTFVSYHWPLSAYTDAFARNRLAITELREGGGNDDSLMPWFLFGRAHKLL